MEKIKKLLDIQVNKEEELDPSFSVSSNGQYSVIDDVDDKSK